MNDKTATRLLGLIPVVAGGSGLVSWSSEAGGRSLLFELAESPGEPARHQRTNPIAEARREGRSVNTPDLDPG